MTTRRLAAILAADVVGYSKLIGKDEAGTLRIMQQAKQVPLNRALGPPSVE